MAKYDERIPGSITKTSDSQLERISEISNVNRTITEMQRKIDQEVSQTIDEVDKYEGIKDVQNSLSKVLNIMGNTVGNIGKGFTKIASETSKASADAIKQYGRAITQDININKQNLLAMTLARSTPIFGYFAAKFMETDVFKRAREKMSANIAAALGSLTSKFREGFTGFVSRIRGKRKGGKEDLDKISEEYNIPKMQRGGIVKKEGLAHLHAGEAIMPIEKILDRIDESISLSRNLSQISTRTQMNMLSKMDRFISYGADTSKKNIFSAFISAAGDVHRQYEQPAEMRMLRSLLAIQDALGAQIGKWSQVWQKLLMEHPAIRQIVFSLKTLYMGLVSFPAKIVYSFFKPRGGYQNQVSRSRNPMEAVAQNTGILYVGSMWRLDNIAKFTRAAAEATRDLSGAITGKKYPALEGVPTGIWSIIGLGRGLLNFLTKHGTKALGKLLGHILLFPEITDSFNKLAITLTRTRKLPKFGRAKEMEAIYGKGTPTQITDIDPQQIKRAERREEKKVRNEIKLIEYIKDVEENTAAQTKISKWMKLQKKAEMMYGIGKSVWKTISSLIGPLLLFAMGLIRNPKKAIGFITRPFIRGLGTMFLSFIGRLSSAIVSGISKMFIFSKNVLKNIKLGGIFGKIGGGVAGKVALPIVLIMGAYNIIADFIRGWKEGGILSGLRKAFIGEKEGGLMSAFKTSGKWAAIGAGIGTVVFPGPGTLVGGIIGTVIGAVLGFFGSDRLKEGIKKISKSIVGKFLGGLWWVIKKVFSVGWKVIKASAKGGWKAIKWVGKKVAEIISWPFRKLYSLMQLAGEFIKEKLQNTPVIGWVLDKTGILPRDQSSKIQEIQQKEEKSWWAKAKSAVSDKKPTDVPGINFSGISDFDHSGTIDKGKDPLVKSADLLKEGYTQGMSQAQVLQSLENISDKLDKASDKITASLTNNANFVTTNVTSQMNNTTQAISNMGSRGKEKMSNYSEKVLRGSLEEDFVYG